MGVQTTQGSLWKQNQTADPRSKWSGPADVIITGLDFVRLEKGQSLASYDIMLGISVRKHKSEERNWPKERNRLVFR